METIVAIRVVFFFPMFVLDLVSKGDDNCRQNGTLMRGKREIVDECEDCTIGGEIEEVTEGEEMVGEEKDDEARLKLLEN